MKWDGHMSETIQTVGIDIGTTTTSLVLAQLTIQNTTGFSNLPHIQIINKQITYRSPIIFTPFSSSVHIDGSALQTFVSAQYRYAKVDKRQIKMGAVIMTGETARKQNAAEILQSLSQFAGNFVGATAGPRLESLIAGKGANHSLLREKPELPIINLDIGGGTTNLAYFKDGKCSNTACLDVGGRLIKLDHRHKITYVAPKLQEIISKLNLPLKLGSTATPAGLAPIITELVKTIEKLIGFNLSSPFYDLLETDPLIAPIDKSAVVSISGGISDCLFSKLPQDPFRYGDIGILLGHALKNSALFKSRHVIYPSETIGATVIGAGSQTVTISGSTINYSHEVLPLRNVPVIKLTHALSDSTTTELTSFINHKLALYQTTTLTSIGISLSHINPDFQSISKEAGLLSKVLRNVVQLNVPIVILMTKDLALFFGNCFREHIPKNYPLVCLDTVSIQDSDYLDIGQPIASGQALPLIIKTLAFE